MKIGLTKVQWILIALIFCAGLFFRFWHIEFGLPHSFYADEPEIAELAIKYTYEFRGIVANGDYYKLIPISYVYGTFPTYLLTIATMGYSKVHGILGATFEKMDIYVFLRSITALFSLLIIPVAGALYNRLFKDKTGMLITMFLLALNWKLIVHAHYVNADIYQATLLVLSFLTLYIYTQNPKVHWPSIFTGIFFGLAVGTKITTLITYPLYMYVFLSQRMENENGQRDYRAAIAFSFIVFGAFIVTNPFSIWFLEDFLLRIYDMLFKEAGMVFDSVDSNPFKYVVALSYIASFPVLLASLYGKVKACKNLGKDKVFHVFMWGNVLIYLLFFSLQARRVDRWLLPILPIILVYGVYGMRNLWKMATTKKSKVILGTFYFLAVSYYLFFPGLLLFQFQRNTPKSAAYVWAQENVPITANKLGYTEEGLDPLNKLEGERVIKYEVYSSEGAQFFLPENPEGYDYVILSSRPMNNFKRPEVKAAYPWYSEKWEKFEETVLDSTKFELEKDFTLPKPNLIPLSDVYIYKSVSQPQ